VQSAPSRHVLTINTGSSSLKAAVYDAGGPRPELKLAAVAERLGPGGRGLRITDPQGRPVHEDGHELPDHEAALRALFEALKERPLDAVGHRVVHGGSRYSRPERVTPALTDALRELAPIDPTHLPQAIAAIETVGELHPSLPQVACFDTAFHRGMPRVAQLYPLPRELAEAGIIRYGFHGLSYEYIVDQMRSLDPDRAGGRMVVAHLGNGASMAAIRDGQPVDTTMGFTPTGGLMMGTRTGDLDPGVLLHLLVGRDMSPGDVDQLVNRQSGLLGLSGKTGDMRELLAAEATDERGAEAIELFCYQARKFLGALVAVLRGLDTLVFTGGIGEHAAPVRQRICAGLDYLDIRVDEEQNQAGSAVISTDGSAVTVRVIPTDEDVMIARHTAGLLWPSGANDVSL